MTPMYETEYPMGIGPTPPQRAGLTIEADLVIGRAT
jgi:hypothetical protein